MYLVVRSIDFPKKTISLEVGRSMAFAHFEHLGNFIGYCGDLGFSNIDIRYPSDMPPTWFSMLQKLERTEGFPVLSVSPWAGRPPLETPDPDRCACVGRYQDGGRSVDYGFACRDMSTVLDDLTTTVLLIGYSIPLDEESLSYLRLCLYELSANTVEHGTFDHEKPEIKVALALGDDCVVVKYSDNAGAFCTLRSKRDGIADRIKQRSKRGLGLLLLNNVTEGLSYERDSMWNHTRFIIRRKQEASCNLDRRTDMNDLSIVVTRTDSPETVVLKSSGSINSSTVPQLDSSFNALLRNGQNTIVLDLSETEFISSSGVGLLLGTVSSLRERSGDLVLMNPSKLVNDILDVLNIKIHFRIIKDVNELKVGARP